ncbi:hypothetical protein BV20DRAFT_373199 [Pilatotrama ljubarskyi]|nr:hypothetical protein BV20DRAFT_373199 [Pilatotrama ljubarskyi]
MQVPAAPDLSRTFQPTGISLRSRSIAASPQRGAPRLGILPRVECAALSARSATTSDGRRAPGHKPVRRTGLVPDVACWLVRRVDEGALRAILNPQGRSAKRAHVELHIHHAELTSSERSPRILTDGPSSFRSDIGLPLQTGNPRSVRIYEYTYVEISTMCVCTYPMPSCLGEHRQWLCPKTRFPALQLRVTRWQDVKMVHRFASTSGPSSEW